MHYQDTIDDSRQNLRLALEQIGKHGLPIDPLNYCIWYEYASGKNGELKAAIDNHLAAHGAFTEEISQQFFNRYIVSGQERANTLVREELKKVFAEIIAAIKTTKQHFSQSEDNLETINEALAPHLTEADVERIVSQIKHESKGLEFSSVSFRDQLQQATREIDQLKDKMAQYRSEALRDSLTGIDNRRGFEEKLSMAIAKANSTGGSDQALYQSKKRGRNWVTGPEAY